MAEGRRSLSCGRQSPCAALEALGCSGAKEHVREQSPELMADSSYRDESTINLDSDEEEEARNWQGRFRDVFVEKFGHSFSVSVMEATRQPDELNDEENELEPSNEVLFHVGQEIIRAKRPRSVSSPTGYTPRASKPRISAVRFNLPFADEDGLDDSNKENVPVVPCPLSEEEDEEVTNVERIVLLDKISSNVVDVEEEGILAVTMPEEVAASLLESSPISSDIQNQEEQCCTSFIQLNISDMSMKSVLIENNSSEVELGENQESLSTKNISELTTMDESSRNIHVNSSLFLNMSSSEPRPEVTFERTSTESPLVRPGTPESIGRIEYSVPFNTPTRTLTGSVVTPRTRIRAWMDTASNSPVCFETPSPRKTRSQSKFNTPISVGEGAGMENPEATTNSTSTKDTGFDESDDGCSELQCEDQAEETDAVVPGTSSGRSSTKMWREMDCDTDGEDANDELNVHSDEKRADMDMFDEPMEISGRNQSGSKIEDMFNDSIDKETYFEATPVKSSQDDLDDTITQMEKLLALADEAETRELKLEQIGRFPPNLPCDEETEKSFEKRNSPMQCTPIRSNGKPGKKLIKNAKNSGPKRTSTPVPPVVSQKRASHEIFKAPKYPYSSAPPKQIGSCNPQKTKIHFNTPSGTGVSTPKAKVPTPTFTSTPHKPPVDIPLSSPASTIGSPVPYFQNKMLTPRKIPNPMQARELVPMSPVIDYIYCTPPVVNLSRAVKKRCNSGSQEGREENSNKRNYAFGSNLPTGSGRKKSGIPVFKKATSTAPVVVPISNEIKQERKSGEFLEDSNLEEGSLNWLSSMNSTGRARLSTDPKTPPPIRISCGGGRYVEREVSIHPRSVEILKTSENYKKLHSSQKASDSKPLPTPRAQLKAVNYIGRPRSQPPGTKPVEIKMASPAEKCLTPVIAVGKDFLSQRHIGMLNKSGNASLLEKESVKKAYVPSRIAKLLPIVKK